MPWTEMEFCQVWRDNSEAEREFVDEACFQLNYWKPVIEDFFAARGESGRTFLRHIDGRTKTKIRVKPDMHTVVGDPLLGRLGRMTTAGPGMLLLDQSMVDCCRGIYDGTIPAFQQGANLVPFSMADRYWALLEVSTIILHELNHVVWKLGEKRAYCMEGFFRHRVQADLGMAALPLCGQTNWACGACVDTECSTFEMAMQMADISDWPTIPGCS